MTREPINNREWQEAVDAATKLLENETARRFGLVNVERCEELLEKGAGVRPQAAGFVMRRRVYHPAYHPAVPWIFAGLLVVSIVAGAVRAVVLAQ